MNTKVPKTIQLALAVLDECRDINDVTQLKLYKLLYLAEVNYFSAKNVRLTSTRYIKNDHGPTPCFSPDFFRQLKAYAQIIKEENGYLYYYLKNGINTSDIIKDIDYNFVRENTKKYKYLSASDLRKLTHQDTPFLMAKYLKTIDIENVLYRDEEETDPNELAKEQKIFSEEFDKDTQTKASNRINKIFQGCSV